ncbi:MAG: glycogen debranching protein GlgX, partial [Polyangiales bacterium]
VDPYARAIAIVTEPDRRRRPVERPLGVVLGASELDFDWGDDRPLRTAWRDTVIYEAHVKGLTRRHPDVPLQLAGTFAGLACPPVLEHLRALGVTAVELLPVHHRVSEPFLAQRGLSNYWGYSTLGFFAPDARFSSLGTRGGQVRDFKAMVKALHRAGLEVILDVVYNHTCEGGVDGPTLSFRGLDNASYYRLDPNDRSKYRDFTGCGNSLDLRQPDVLAMVLDSLRYWVGEMHVDGFRFDLATTLARGAHGFDPASAFFTAIHQDPMLRDVKLISESWDVGEGGYQVGGFPPRWSEWNGRFRDDVRRFWAGYEPRVSTLASRLAGSSDVFDPPHSGRRGPRASVNFVTAHDGFTLRDLVTYERKRNDKNGESNRDGESNNNGWNCGVEGETRDAGVRALRRRQAKNLLLTTLLSQGVPMILGGDELARTQHGNNNAYCLDDETSWGDWTIDDEKRSMLEFARRALRFRALHSPLRSTTFLRASDRPGRGAVVTWLDRDAKPMNDAKWSADGRALTMLVGDEAARVLVAINGERTPVPMQLPSPGAWAIAIDTGRDAVDDRPLRSSTMLMEPLSMRVLVPG